MAVTVCHVLLFVLANSVFVSPIVSRITPDHKTSQLEVSSIIQQTLDVLTIKPSFKNDQELAKTSSLSVSLHPRSALHHHGHNDYKSLTRARLERDAARVASINNKLEFGLAGLNKSNLTPVDTVVSQEALSTPLTSGVSHGSGEYFARLGVGQPAKTFLMAVDTGSDVNWLQCEPCSDCYQQSDPIFNPAQSSTYRKLSCGASQCSQLEISGCRADTCMYQVSYGDGSFTVGDLVSETVSVGNSGFQNIAIGCGHDNEGLFTGSDGLLALGGSSLSLPSQIKASSFSYCLVNRDAQSASTLEFNSAIPPNSITAPVLRNSRMKTFFYVSMTGISVGGQPLAIPSSIFAVDDTGRGGIILDSGTAITRLRTEAYNSLRDAFKSQARDLKSADGFSLFDTCYDLSGLRSVSVPTVSFQFSGGKTLQLRPNEYLIPVDSSGKFCLAFAPTQGSLSIIGNVQQQGTRVSYDIGRSVVGFTPNSC